MQRQAAERDGFASTAPFRYVHGPSLTKGREERTFWARQTGHRVPECPPRLLDWEAVSEARRLLLLGLLFRQVLPWVQRGSCTQGTVASAMFSEPRGPKCSGHGGGPREQRNTHGRFPDGTPRRSALISRWEMPLRPLRGLQDSGERFLNLTQRHAPRPWLWTPCCLHPKQRLCF